MKFLSFAGAAVSFCSVFCSVSLLAMDTPPLPLSTPMPKPVPLILLIDGPDAPTASHSVEKAAPAEAVESTVEAAPEPNVVFVQPTVAEVETNTAAVAAKKNNGTINKVWAASIAALLGGTMMDAASSWGKSETNPLLRSANGTFGMRGLMIKGGLAGAMIAPEILMRNNEDAKKKFAIANFIAAGVFSAVVFHNVSIPKVK